ncbi:flavin reductase [Ruminococcus sp. NK3A76]|uniref:flavin reductase n=1 Tax=Ruminococcus sp. NK3A76 TaxID=877411 RepID=UPI00048FC7E4|nr:flavin reductase [Ruminococcus sp. NK3A76]
MADMTQLRFKQTAPDKIGFDPFVRIGAQWMLVTAGDESGFNTMTASWGFAGVMWGKPCVETVIRPQRYTKEFLDKSEYFTLSFFPETNRKDLAVCGRISGRDEDKLAQTSLTPVFTDGTVTFEQAELVLVCKKLYVQQLSSDCFTERDLDGANYAAGDYHHAYIAEIVKAYVK